MVATVTKWMLGIFWILLAGSLIYVEVQEGDVTLSLRTVMFSIVAILSVMLLFGRREAQVLLLLSWGMAALVVLGTAIVIVTLHYAGFTVVVDPEIANMMFVVFGCGTLMVTAGRIILL